MATIARQPFAPLDGARLQALTSTKNRQNAAQSFAAKRKAPSWTEADDSENVDPNLSAKRSKGLDGSAPAHGNGMIKKSPLTLTKASISSLAAVANILDPAKLSPIASTSRPVLKPRAPSAKISTAKISTSPIRLSPLASSSGRSSMRASRRGGILTSKRRAVSNLSRATPAASSNFGSAAPFSLDAALKGTISSFERRLATSALAPSPASNTLLDESSMSSSWFFDIHEDTPEQEMTNLLQHSTCVLDISSDEETEQKARRERAEGRDKENIPPPNDVSQTSSARMMEPTDEMSVDKARNPLSQLNAADYYATGCDEASVVLVASDEPEEQGNDAPGAEVPSEVLSEVPSEEADTVVATQQESIPEETAPAVPEISVPPEEANAVEDIMANRENPSCEAALLEPIDGTGESFQLWESGSLKDEDL